jgi:hypothetical protein
MKGYQERFRANGKMAPMGIGDLSRIIHEGIDKWRS